MARTQFGEVVMRLPRYTILTSSCLSMLITFGAISPAIAAPENEKVAQRRRVRAGGGNQIEVVGYVKGIIGNVVTILIDDEEELGIPGIAENDGEPTFVTIPATERGQLRTLYFSPMHNIEIAGLVPGMRLYAIVGKKDDDPNKPCGCIDFFKVIPDYNYERVEVRLPQYNFQGPPSLEFPPLQPPPPIRRPTPPPPVRGLW
ncbi:MAG: hypothetical protein F6K40_15415 [Okeania sp. SIO3I5]|uniref:hypothetical protein n=1 Tax=Okeania sp. SIO3I5 TaxID=2607805 RepID=UPI0013BE16D4|nr:hypothetical protein [Okeania sp. SIO3I5]NEQ37581.1 hypothetical protein [Okeania sp. SIO3I5]